MEQRVENDAATIPPDAAAALIAAHIEPYPGTPDLGEYRLRDEDNGYPVWAIIGSLLHDGATIAHIAHEYEIAAEAVEAAWAFYLRHREAIDARIAANRVY